MYIIREIFTAKPGQAGKLAKMFKKMNMPKVRVMTDMVGPYNTVVTEIEVDSLAEWEQQMKDYKAGKPDPNMTSELEAEMKNYHEMYLMGRREVYQVTE